MAVTVQYPACYISKKQLAKGGRLPNEMSHSTGYVLQHKTNTVATSAWTYCEFKKNNREEKIPKYIATQLQLNKVAYQLDLWICKKSNFYPFTFQCMKNKSSKSEVDK